MRKRYFIDENVFEESSSRDWAGGEKEEEEEGGGEALPLFGGIEVFFIMLFERDERGEEDNETGTLDSSERGELFEWQGCSFCDTCSYFGLICFIGTSMSEMYVCIKSFDFVT